MSARPPHKPPVPEDRMRAMLLASWMHAFGKEPLREMAPISQRAPRVLSRSSTPDERHATGRGQAFLEPVGRR